MISKRLSRNEYQTLVEQAPIMIWRADSTAGCDYFNDTWLQFRGRCMERECGNRWAEVVAPSALLRAAGEQEENVNN